MARNNAVSVVLCKFLILACNPSYVFLYTCVVCFVCYITKYNLSMYICVMADTRLFLSFLFSLIVPRGSSLPSSLLYRKARKKKIIHFLRIFTRIFICASTMRTATTSNLRQPPVLCERENGTRGKFGSSWCSVAPPPPLPPWLGRAGSVWVLARNGDGVASAWLRCLRWAPASRPLRSSFGGRSGPPPPQPF